MDETAHQVGSFRLEPDRQLTKEGRPVAIGGKQLALLSVLARAGGELVTKDELMSAVWPNAIVEENAIQAQIAGLRKVLGTDADRLITARGIGYRLATSEMSGEIADHRASAAAPPLAAVPDRPHLARRFARIATLIGAGAVVLALVHGTTAPDRGSDATTVEVRPLIAQGGGESRSFAAALSSRIASTLAGTQAVAVRNGVVDQASGITADGRVDPPDLSIAGEVQAEAGGLDVSVHIDDPRTHTLLWSSEVRGRSAASHALETGVAARVVDTLRWARDGRTGRVRLDGSTLASFIAARELSVGSRDGGDAVALAEYRKVIAAAPEFASGHSGAATADASLAEDEPSLLAARALREESRREAARALALDRRSAEAYMALEMTTPSHKWATREALMLRGIAADPDFEPLVMLAGRLAWAVGRSREALGWFERAHGVNPLFIHATGSLVLALAADGRAAQSDALLAQMRRDWPDADLTKNIGFWAAFVAGRDDEALAILDDPARRRSDMAPPTLRAWRAAIRGLRGDAATRATAEAATLAAVRAGWMPAGSASQLLARLGAVDAAFAQVGPDADLFGLPWLFLPPAARLRADPRFMRIAQRFGLVDYWQATGRWPDFCAEPKLPYDCRIEAAKVARVPHPG